MSTTRLQRPISAENIPIDTSLYSGNLSGVTGDLKSVCDAIDSLTVSGGSADLTQLQDVMAAIALQTYATAGLQVFTHTRIDTLADDDDLTGTYTYDEENNCICAVDDGWTEMKAVTVTTDDSYWMGQSLRYVLSSLVYPGVQVIGARVTFEANSGNDTVLAHASIGISSGTDSETTATPTELLFSEASGVTITAGQQVTSDVVEFSPTSGDNIVVIIDFDDSVGYHRYVANPSGITSYGKSGDTYNQAAPSGMSPNPYTSTLVKVEFQTAWYDIDCHTTAFEASDIDPTSAYLILDMNPNTLVPGTGIIAKLSIDNGSNKETFTFESDPILTISGDRALYRANIAATTAQGDQTVIAYFETNGVTSASNNPSIYGYVLGLAWE